MQRITDDEIEQLSWRIERQGLRGCNEALRRVAARARAEGLSPVLASIVADETEPEVARLRALGLLALRLGTATPPARRAA